MRQLEHSEPSFFNYLLSNWLHIKRKWAFHAQRNMVHFGNTTNNRIENANRRLKEAVCPRDCLIVSMQKVWAYTERLLHEQFVQATLGSDRRLVLPVRRNIRTVLNRLTTYAAKLVWHHVHRRQPPVQVEAISQSQVRMNLSTILLLAPGYSGDRELSC